MSDEWFYLKRWRAIRAAEETSRPPGEVSDVHDDKPDEAPIQELDDGTDDPIHRQDPGTPAAPPPSDVR